MGKNILIKKKTTYRNKKKGKKYKEELLLNCSL